jgi:hypothetical protein
MIVRLHEEDSSGSPIGVRDGMVNQQLLLQFEYLLVNDNTKLNVRLPR